MRIFRVMLVLLVVGLACSSPPHPPESDTRKDLARRIEHSIETEMLNSWYPRVLDTVYGGYLSTFTREFEPTGPQDKMIVTQSRHLWTSSKAFQDHPDVADFRKCAEHGFRFLRDVMWDQQYGGFYWLVDRQGNVKDDRKTAYGNAFAIYGLAAYVHAFGDTAALELAKKGFYWLEKYSHDPVHRGYFQHLARDGKVVVRDKDTPAAAETGYKDQNSSIHLLEAFTELYQVWPDPLVRQRVEEMLVLIRDTIATDKGYLQLFLYPDWKPVSFRDSSAAFVREHKNLDHVSFGHDVETAYLMLEASHVIGIKNDSVTRSKAKKLVDHALNNGWDAHAGGFYDEGYYFRDSTGITILRDSKNWWAQAEGLNTLLIMADLYPEDPQQYFQKFEKLWHYIDTQLIDHEYGEWYQGGLDKEPKQKGGLKGHIWKASYHQYRSLSNCVKRLRGNQEIH